MSPTVKPEAGKRWLTSLPQAGYVAVLSLRAGCLEGRMTDLSCAGMDRRRFVLISLFGSLAVPLVAEAQQTATAYRVGYLGSFCPRRRGRPSWPRSSTVSKCTGMSTVEHAALCATRSDRPVPAGIAEPAPAVSSAALSKRVKPSRIIHQNHLADPLIGRPNRQLV